MKKIIQELRQNKLLLLLTIITAVSILLGILFPAILSDSNKTLIKTNITDFMDAINKDNINYLSGLITSITNNLLVTIIIWILGLSFIGIPFLLIILFFKGFLAGFSLTSIFLTYGIKGILSAIIYSLPNFLNVLGYLLLIYYAISFSLAIYQNLFKKKMITWSPYVKRYGKIGITFIIFAIIISLIETFGITKLLQLL